MMRFNDLSMTYHLVRTHDRETESHINYTLRFIFYSTRLPLHTARYHWWIVRAYYGYSGSTILDELRVKSFYDRDYSISHYQIKLNLWGHIIKKLDLE